MGLGKADRRQHVQSVRPPAFSNMSYCLANTNKHALPGHHERPEVTYIRKRHAPSILSGRLRSQAHKSLPKIPAAVEDTFRFGPVARCAQCKQQLKTSGPSKQGKIDLGA